MRSLIVLYRLIRRRVLIRLLPWTLLFCGKSLIGRMLSIDVLSWLRMLRGDRLELRFVRVYRV